MKIFEIIHPDGEKEWFTGQNLLSALNNYINTTECDLYDLTECEITELPKELYSFYIVQGETEDQDMNFEQWLKENQFNPEIIAGTMYDRRLGSGDF